MRKSVYWPAIIVAAAALGCSLFASRQTRWIVYQTPAASPLRFASRFGLWSKCDAGPLDFNQGSDSHTHWTCRAFPLRQLDCRADKHKRPSLLASHVNASSPIDGDFSISRGSSVESFRFCDLWRSAAYSHALACAFGAAAIIVMLIVVAPPYGGRRRREQGWKVASTFMALKCAFSIVAIALIGRLYDADDRFWAGSRLATSFVLACVVAGVDLVWTGAMVFAGASGLALGPNSRARMGYTPIP